MTKKLDTKKLLGFRIAAGGPRLGAKVGFVIPGKPPLTF